MKRNVSMLAVFMAMIMVLTACGGKEASSDDTAADGWKGGTLTLLVPSAAGGGLDGMARLLAPYLQEELPEGSTVVVENLTGGSGWVAWNHMFSKEADGLTVTCAYTPQIFSYLNPELQISHNIDSFGLLCNMVFDSATICVASEDARFSDVNSLQDFVDYLKANEDKSFSVAVTSAEGGDHLAMLEFCELAGITNLKETYYSAVADSAAAFMGRHVDVYFGKVGDTLSMYQDGSAKVLAVCKEERSSFMPDVPTADEQGYDVLNGSARGWCVRPDTAPEIQEALMTALEAAFNNEGFQSDMATAGYDLAWYAGADYEAFMKGQEDVVKQFSEELGYNQ